MTKTKKIWTGENDFSLFKSSVPIDEKSIWRQFYQLHKSKVQVQKEKVAIEKLSIIVKTTFKLSNDKGFALTSLRDLSQASGISMGSLYAYIGSKRQLAEMIHQFLPHMFDLCIGNDVIQSGAAQQQLEKLIRGHLFITECLQPWFFFAFMETKHLNDETKTLAKNNELRSEIWLETIISRGISDGEFSCVDRFLTSMMIKSLLQNWYVKRGKYRLADVDCESYLRFIEQVIKQFMEKS